MIEVMSALSLKEEVGTPGGRLNDGLIKSITRNHCIYFETKKPLRACLPAFLTD